MVNGAFGRKRTGEIAVQVDGRTRGTVEVPKQAPVEAVRARVANDKVFGRFLAGRKVVREIYVPGRVYSLVTE